MKSIEDTQFANAAAMVGCEPLPPPRSNLTWPKLYIRAGLILLVLSTLACLPLGCSFPYFYHADLLPSDALQMEAHGQSVDVWLEFGETDVFTPTTTASGITLQTGDGQTIPYLDELAEKGYLAIRVPHAPPTYTLSSLLPGIPPGEPDAMTFSYYSPPSTTTLTTVAVSVTRRVDLEQIVNVQYPIANNQSHWEVWWLPQGEQFPFPDQPFRLDADSWPPSLGLRFRIDFGSEASALDCAGCPVEVLGYNGYLFAGPYSYALRYGNLTIPDPQASFGVHCAYEDTPLNPTAVQYITPTVPFTHTYCLENWDTVTHTFTITTSSSQGWDYTYYYQSTESDSVPVPVPNVPFTITVGPPPNQWTPGLLGIIAVHAPNIAVTDTMRETLHITATSVISPSVWAYSGSFCLAPSYQLNEGGGGFRLYLPLVVR